MLISNGHLDYNYGYKFIVLDPQTYTPRDVKNVNRSGKPTDRFTNQESFEGDLVYGVSWDRETGTHHTTSKVVNGEVIQVNREEYLDWRGLAPEITQWLQPERAGQCYLPAGLGWDGVMSKADFSKLDRVKRFFYNVNDEIKACLIEAARFAPGWRIPTKWSEAAPLPNTLELLPATEPDQWEALMIWDTTGFKEMVKSEDKPYRVNFDTQSPKKVAKIYYNRGYVAWELYRA